MAFFAFFCLDKATIPHDYGINSHVKAKIIYFFKEKQDIL